MYQRNEKTFGDQNTDIRRYDASDEKMYMRLKRFELKSMVYGENSKS